MKKFGINNKSKIKVSVITLCIILFIPLGLVSTASLAKSSVTAPAPLLKQDGAPVNWWFVFKFNAKSLPGCANNAARSCTFGGTVQTYKNGFSQQYVYASSENASLQAGSGCIGDSKTDPVGATFNQVYNGTYNYVLWNDQFYADPAISGCTKECGAPWGHSKGILVWDNAGNGFVMQVSTPSWPASGSAQFPRKTDGNTLGCLKDDDIEVSQHFFALRLNKNDLVATLQALQNASVVTDPTNPQIVHNGGPADVQTLVKSLGKKSTSSNSTIVTLSSGVRLISKPSNLFVPPWQLVSAKLNGLPLVVATWWETPKIPSTTPDTQIDCWDQTLGKPGPVEIAKIGHWNNSTFNLTGGEGPDHNHAKIGVSTDPSASYTIFGDMNQQGALSMNCKNSQNGRGGIFFALPNKTLNQGIANLIHEK